MLDALLPLQRVTDAGAAVLLLHHPKKEKAEEGSTARGSGALTGFVDVVLELTRFGRLRSDNCRRRLVGFSRYAETPRTLVYSWAPDAGTFEPVTDLINLQFQENWEQVEAILKSRKAAATHRELLDDWPIDQPPPAPATLYAWLNQATAAKLVRRAGQGIKTDPFRFRLPNEDDKYYDRGQLPPLRFDRW
ncbi:MAG TPA: hypothetical protein VGJ05_10560 [Fimbriiglobus sp.]|jgi:hypothetical protein